MVHRRLAAGARRAGRSLQDFDLACGFPTLVASDDRAFEQHRGQILMFATAAKSSPFYADSFGRAGFSDLLGELQDRVGAGDVASALERITPEMVNAVTLTGSPEQVRARMGEYRQAGVKTVAVNPSPPGVYFPLYQGHFPEGTQFPPFSFPDFLSMIETTIDSFAQTDDS